MTSSTAEFNAVVLDVVRRWGPVQWHNLINAVAERVADRASIIPPGGFERVLNIALADLEDSRLVRRDIAGISAIAVTAR